MVLDRPRLERDQVLSDWLRAIAMDKKNLLSMGINCQDHQLSFDLGRTLPLEVLCELARRRFRMLMRRQTRDANGIWELQIYY